MSHLAQGFSAFSLLHGLSIAGCVVVIFVVVRAGRAARRAGHERRFTVGVAVVGLLLWLAQQGYYVGLDRQWAYSLPLHVCDLAALIGPLALLFRTRFLRTTLYFWAFGLSVWGLITPTLGSGPGSVKFWLFWLNHGGVMLFGFYDVVVGGYRPLARDFGTACLATLAYLALLMPLNLAYEGWNYAYIGAVKPTAWTPLELLPAWPWRITGIQVLGAFMLANAWLPWEVVRWRQRRRLSAQGKAEG